MGSLNLILLVLQAIIAVSLIFFILIQHGKGADAGAAFGSGASSTVFGSQGAANFLTRTTAVLACFFIGNSLLLGYLATKQGDSFESLMDGETMFVEDLPEAEPVTPANESLDDDSDVPLLPPEAAPVGDHGEDAADHVETEAETGAETQVDDAATGGEQTETTTDSPR